MVRFEIFGSVKFAHHHIILVPVANNRFSLYESMSASLYDSFMSHNVGGHGAKPGDFVRVNCTGIVF